MARKKQPKRENTPKMQGFIAGAGEIQAQDINDTLRQNYMPYAMSVIMSRAIPEIDGFKPSHRKLLYTMYKMNLLGSARTKSANIVGQTMKLNPHGDSAIYDTMVRLSRGYEALLHPYVDSKGNFGKFYSRDMAWAASRYTEARLDPICRELFRDIDKDTVDFVDNYDSTMKEPTLLPAAFPSVLVNANTGIAVGMASSICPFNLAEVCTTAAELIRDPKHDIFTTILPHGEIHIAFTPDEEIGAGPDKFDVKGFGCDFAYTLDGGELGGLDYENFNGTSADVEITGRSVHPGSAKNKMINASRVAMEFASLLPSREVPENTEGYEGFAHLNSMEGDVERAHLHYIIRDHDRDLLEARKDKFNLAAEFINRKYGLELVKVTLKDAYSNMKEMILPHQEILDVARAAMRKNGVEPVTTPIRGGTDGARLSFMGLPCPNLCTGGELAHGRNEFAVLEEMETIVEIVKSIAELVE